MHLISNVARIVVVTAIATAKVVIDEYDDAITDPGLLFNNEILDEDYYLEKYRGFGPSGWDCIDLLVKTTDNEIINKLFDKINK